MSNNKTFEKIYLVNFKNKLNDDISLNKVVFKNSKLRKNAWNSLENVPLQFEIIDYIFKSYYTLTKDIIMRHPHGFYFLINTENAIDIIRTCDIKKGVIINPLKFYFVDSKVVLLPAKDES